jgi:DNA polymerase
VFKFEDGKIERKGGYVKPLTELDNDLPIVNKALVANMIDGLPVEDVINSCIYLKDFQKIVKVSNKYVCAWHAVSKLGGACKYKRDKGDARFHLYTCTNENVHNPDTFGEVKLNACKCDACQYYEGTVVNGKNIKLSDKTFRVFASKDPHDGYIGKQKKEGATIEKFANTPEHCFIENGDINNVPVPDKLDRQYYINLAKERLKQFGVN